MLQVLRYLVSLEKKTELGALGNDGKTRKDYVRVDRTEVAFHPTHFLFEHLMPKARLELSLPQGSRRDIHRFLTTAQ